MNYRKQSFHPRSKRGGVLLVAIIFSAISAISVASFLKLAQNELRLSNIHFYYNESLNLAEAGLEEALYAMNFYNWGGWAFEDDTARMVVRDIALGRSATGEFHVLVKDRSTHPIVIAEGRVRSGSGLSTSKQVKIDLQRRSYFANGIMGRESVTFSGGNAYVDSYQANGGNTPYHSSRRRDRGTVASPAISDDAVNIGNGHVWGYVLTGQQLPRWQGGTVLGEDSPSDVKVDMNRVSQDFSATFPRPMNPPPPTVYYSEINSGMTLGIPGASDPLVIRAGSVKLNNRELKIVGPVFLIVDGDVDMSGNSGGLTVEETGMLRVYAHGDFKVTGKGMSNMTHDPARMVIFGMSHYDPQRFDLGGNAAWEAAVYAPNADLSLNGGGNSGQMSGAVVGRRVTIVGGSNFHYDEDLTGFTDGFGFTMGNWEEVLNAADRIAFN